MKSLIAIFNFFFLYHCIYCVEKLRGIPFSKLSFYQPNTPFKCIDGSGTISWNKVNDDYCDCRDGSDEPGTAACHNGLFFCENKGHKAEYILSSRVNDGICDCCDGQDEYSGVINCTNNCWQLGAVEREKVKKLKEAAEKGHQIYLQYAKDYEATVGEKRARLEVLIEQLKLLNEDKLSIERTKSDAESRETEAKRAFEEVWKTQQSENETVLEKSKISIAFKELDTDGNGRVSYEELKDHSEFDIDQNGDVSAEEAKEYLNENESVDETEFSNVIWSNIKQIFKFKQNEISSDEGTVPDQSDESLHDDKSEEKPKMEYDDAVKKLIGAADEARSAYNEIDSRLRKMEEEKVTIEELLNNDYGPNSAFYHLADDSACHELTNHEYTYKLCPFKRVVQTSKNGGSETELGRWGRWIGKDDLYSAQIYENGATCWNGPSRQTKVELSCGVENKLISASEPSRCEYLMHFETPASCNKSPEQISSEHDEL